MNSISHSPNQLITCNDCGQTWRCERLSALTSYAPRYCPGCGSSSVAPLSTGAAAKRWQASCFARYDAQLLDLLWEQWVEDIVARQTFASFIGYVEHLVREAARSL